MNRHTNGTVVVGGKGSYQRILSGLNDLLKATPKDFEVFHFGERLKKEGLRIGLSKERINSDFINAHN